MGWDGMGWGGMGMEWHGMAWHYMVYSMVSLSMVWYGMVWYGMVLVWYWYGMVLVWYGMVYGRCAHLRNSKHWVDCCGPGLDYCRLLRCLTRRRHILRKQWCIL